MLERATSHTYSQTGETTVKVTVKYDATTLKASIHAGFRSLEMIERTRGR